MKKITTILMTCLIMLVVVLSGCASFRIDKVKYYNEVLATVDETQRTVIREMIAAKMIFFMILKFRILLICFII